MSKINKRALVTMSRTKHKALTLLGVGCLLGIAVWFFSPWLTGKVEPWDADAPIWSLSWLLLAVLGGLVGHIRGACLPLGYALGQMLITTRSVFVGEFGALAWVFIGGYAVAAVSVTLGVLGVAALFKRVPPQNPVDRTIVDVCAFGVAQGSDASAVRDGHSRDSSAVFATT